MESKKFLKDISASTIQVAITQIANLLIFYLISKYISKEEFGFYNWSVALISTIITVFSLGMDLVYVKRVASGHKPETTISIHFFHTILSSVFLIVVASICCTFFFPNLQFKDLFLLIVINQSVFTVANSIKLCLNGYERFNKLAIIAIITSLTRVVFVVTLLITSYFTINMLVMAFILSYLIEFGISYYIAGTTLRYYIKPKASGKEYSLLIRESLPQLGTVLFDSALARIDWILMGIIATAVKTAEYSFAYKMFEVSKIPFLVIAPILLTRFSKLFSNKQALDASAKNNIDSLFKTEMFIAILAPVIVILIWTDFFDLITDQKYGAVNQITYTILGICIPLQYTTNFLWTMAFAQGQLKMIFVITVITSSINILLNIILIKTYGAEGAAFAFLISSFLQIAFYYRLTLQDRYTLKIQVLLIYMLLGTLIVLCIYWLPIHFIFKALLALIIYLFVARISNLFSIKILKSAFI
jgi:O-antigen/teichoic acid export membrane protein